MREARIAAVSLGVKVPESAFVSASEAQRMRAGHYEGAEVRGALHVVRPGDVVLELGAGIGLVGAAIVRHCRVAHLHAFEANPDLIRPCRRLYRLNRMRRRITLRNEVLLSGPLRPAHVPFYRQGAFRSSSLLPPEGGADSVVEVPTGDFDAFCAAHRPQVLVADIEGGELDLLRHADLGWFRAVVIEFHANRYGMAGLAECKAALRAAGLRRIAEKSTARVWTMARQDAG